MPIDFQHIEKKWQERWEKAGIFRADVKKGKKFYVLEMFPYPSAAGLHMGHVRNYAIGDCFARFKRMQGFNVLYPMGYDAFGLPAENAAIKSKTHPKKYTDDAIASIQQNQKALGLSYDWSRTISTCEPEYYHWNQWLFLQMLKKELAYRKPAPVNWCPGCSTVLANEQVEDGKCWRCGSAVEVKTLEQWFLRITNYADELLEGIDKLDGWPEKIKTMQRNWISRSTGVEVNFLLKGSKEKIPIFTTRPDTIHGVTFLVFSPEHPKVAEMVKGTKYEKPVRDFIQRVVVQERASRTDEKSKEGLFIGRYAINPLTGEAVPIYIANFVLLEYGTGAVMAVPAHDQRDFEFATKYKIPVKVVINPPGKRLDPKAMKEAYVEEGILTNSGKFNSMKSSDAMKEISAHIEKQGFGKRVTRYKLRDWLISRQRYWGTPIPVIYCKRCGMQPVPEKDLPVLLPMDVKFTGHGNPLKMSEKFVKTACPKCGSQAERETDTMDTFIDSSWYFLRYCSPHYDRPPGFNPQKVNQWMPVDQYIGGAEHAVMHLLYARFFYRVLRDLGYVKGDEPFARLFNQGIVYKDGHKMSKSFGNVVTQEEIAKKYGIDTARLFLLFVASPDKQLEWSDEGVIGAFKFLSKVFSMVSNAGKMKSRSGDHNVYDRQILSLAQTAIKDVTDCIEGFALNTAVNRLMFLANEIHAYSSNPSTPHKDVFHSSMKTLITLMSPFTPHLAEEMWEMLGGKGMVSVQPWPKPDERLISKRLEGLAAYVGDVRQDIKEVSRLLGKKPKRICIYVSPLWKYTVHDTILKRVRESKDLIFHLMKDPEVRKHGKRAMQLIESLQKRALAEIPTQDEEYEMLLVSKKSIESETGAKVEIWKEEEPQKHDPKGRAHRAEPLKPAIYIE